MIYLRTQGTLLSSLMCLYCELWTVFCVLFCDVAHGLSLGQDTLSMWRLRSVCKAGGVSAASGCSPGLRTSFRISARPVTLISITVTRRGNLCSVVTTH